MKKSFVLSDETVNQFGFVVLTAGIDLERFKQNPVMLYNHADESGDAKVIGRWENIRIEGTKLMADPVFDVEDPFAKEIAGKVDRGFIKGASVWVDFTKQDVRLNAQGIPVVFNSELMEGSIVPIPNNKNAVRLSADGERICDKKLAAKLSATSKQDTNMKDVALFAAALGITLSAGATEDHLREAIKAKLSALETERNDLKTKLDAITVKLAAEQDSKVTSLIDGAIAGKRLKAEQKDHFTKLAKADFESTKAIIDSMVPHQTITSQLGGGSEGAKNPFADKGLKELMKTDDGGNYLAKLRAGSAEDKAEYKRLWEEAYPGKVFNG